LNQNLIALCIAATATASIVPREPVVAATDATSRNTILYNHDKRIGTANPLVTFHSMWRDESRKAATRRQSSILANAAMQ
jgi:hypothetical protein